MSVRRFDLLETDSTQLEVKRRLDATKNFDEVFYVVARSQSAGRGRLGRSWFGQAGHTLMFSMWLPTTSLHAEKIPLVSLAAGAAVSVWLDRYLPTQIKWPNDILSVDDKKLGGILCEGLWNEANPIGCIVGIGLNVSWPENIPPDPAVIGHATTISNYVSTQIESLFNQLNNDIEGLVSQIVANCEQLAINSSTVIGNINQRLAGKTREVTLKSFESRQCVGYIEGVLDSGKLAFRQRDTNALIEVDSGELAFEDTPIQHINPAQK